MGRCESILPFLLSSSQTSHIDDGTGFSLFIYKKEKKDAHTLPADCCVFSSDNCGTLKSNVPCGRVPVQ